MQQFKFAETAAAATPEGDVQREGTGYGSFQPYDVFMIDVAALQIYGAQDFSVKSGRMRDQDALNAMLFRIGLAENRR